MAMIIEEFLREDPGHWIEWFWVAWWPVVTTVGIRGSQRRRLVIPGYFAGHRDWTRGRHWDRRHRYGVK